VSVAHKLAYVFRDEMPLITTADVAARVMEARIYPIRDPVKPGKNPDFGPLVRPITESIRPNGWDPVAGLGMIESNGPRPAAGRRANGWRPRPDRPACLAERRQPPAPRKSGGRRRTKRRPAGRGVLAGMVVRLPNTLVT
jgi:hypothetical protein